MRLQYHWRWLLTFASIALAVGCGVPLLPPEPDVPPIVDPQPKPVTNAAYIYVLEESAERTVDTALLLADPWWQSSGIEFRVFDKDVPEAKDVAKAANGITLPAIVITDGDGRVLHKGKLPSTIDAIKSLVGSK
jgi:hypothetical protein